MLEESAGTRASLGPLAQNGGLEDWSPIQRCREVRSFRSGAMDSLLVVAMRYLVWSASTSGLGVEQRFSAADRLARGVEKTPASQVHDGWRP